MEVIPTVFSKNKKDFEKRFEKLRNVSKELQIDFMDGKFVKSKSVAIDDVPSLFEFNNVVEAHLMVKNPKDYIEPLRIKGFGRIIFHYESLKNDKEGIELIKNIRKHGMHAIVAINPKTEPKKLNNIYPELHHVLIMGVNPGKEKQKLLKSTYKKIKYIKDNYPGVKIQVDGGVNKENSIKLKKAGADIINSGSLVAESKNPKKTIEQLKNGKY